MRHALEYVYGDSRWATRRTLDASHIRGCRIADGPRCGGAFRCMRCRKLVGWCKGASDGTVADNWCDACADRVKP